jgi:phosphate transport system protein
MAALCREMLAEVARAHRDGDVAGARRAAGRNRELGAQRKQVVDTLLSVMRSEWTLVENGTRLLWMVHSLERCGDRVTNIAEQVVFRVTGETVELA